MKPEEQEGLSERQLEHPVDDAVGGPDDRRATAQAIGSHEIEAVTLMSASAEERCQRLLEMRSELTARRQAGNEDLAPLIEEIDRAVAKLRQQ